ncbi:M15 family metallopeptidase [Cnuibacter physcomitrellae]|uniref:M15 family metallopeptidase n=1 Tax=Cnuibacter physcomitrellae TaxID=1619308 RepID=UPI002175BCBE|nr:M15 family metallopeptidase [Cnuibacter physcomitrellae]MCS5498150.1 M15 family metallopeptidase [Cnuibacter physcomitrellae]
MSRARERERRRMYRRRRLVAALAAVGSLGVLAGVVVAVLLVTGVIGGGAAPVASDLASSATASASPTPEASTMPEPTPTPTPTPELTEPPAPPAFDRTAQSLDDPLSTWVVVNKLRPIQDGADFVPPDLVDLPADMPNPNGYQMRAEAAASLEQMFQAALGEIGVQLVAQSGYRSYSVQVNAYQYYVNQLGVAGADLTSARPGFSEHQTGLAMDILDTVSGCSTDGLCFANTAAGQWLAQNGWRFGWILRYPADKTQVTGYEYEPWHFRYVGVPLATEMHATGVETLEEFFGLPAAPDYAG